MKKIVILTVAIFLSGCLYGKNKELRVAKSIKKSIKKKIKIQNIRNGKVFTQEIYILKAKDSQNKTLTKSMQQDRLYYVYPNGDRFNSKSDIMVKFYNDKDIDIKEIEDRYGLKLIRKMNSGDFLFKNIKGDTLNKINSLLRDKAQKIKRIKPNIKPNIKPL